MISWLIPLVTTIHVLVCAFLIIVVLLQHGQSADIAAAFGGAGSQTAFGTRTAGTVLSRATTYAAIAFMVTSITLSALATRRGVSSGSVLENTKSAPTQQAPAGSSQIARTQRFDFGLRLARRPLFLCLDFVAWRRVAHQVLQRLFPGGKRGNLAPRERAD